MSLPRGTQFDRYEVLSLVGAGGMGEVYLASDSRLGRKVALKLVPPVFAADASRMRRFIREAKAASALNHPNILIVHEIGESGQQPFIVTEFIEGVTVRQQLADGPRPLLPAIDVAMQVASALSAAHAAGIVHRDIKPENIMVRPDGVVKVLDFGLARIGVNASDSHTRVSDSTHTAGAETEAWETTGPGVMLGTTGYMSPEQARGHSVDERSDVFSCGVVLYEMIAGQAPFTGETASDTLAALLKTEPTRIASYAPNAPRALGRVIEKALAKNREERYQSAKDLLVDLTEVKRQLEHGALRMRWPRAHRPRTIAIAAAALLLVAGIAASRFYATRAMPLTDKDTILLADFVNTTGDPVFDHTLKQGVAVQLSQSPFLSIFPESRTRQTLRLMGRSPDELVTADVAREIGQRQGLKAFITGSIAKFDRSYSITLEATASQTGESVAMAQADAAGKDGVLQALSRVATQLRERLGESLSTIQAFDAPLEVTTSSLEALNAYSIGSEEAMRGRYLEAIAFFERAAELDPNFAYAWVGLAVHHFNTRQYARGSRDAEKAFALRDRVSELERLRISSLYSGLVDGDSDEGFRLLERYKRTYPRDPLAPTNLASAYIITGQFDKTIVEAREALRLNPNSASAYSDLCLALLALGEVEQARDTAKQALSLDLDSTDVRTTLFFSAFLLNDTAGMQEQLAWARGRPDEHIALDWQARTAAAVGEWNQSAMFVRRATDHAAQAGASELAARYTAEGALREATMGACTQVRASTNRALSFDRSYVAVTRSALALALCGHAGLVQPLVEELKAGHPKDTLINILWLPTIRAAVALDRGNAREAAQELAVIRFEGAGELWPQYFRGTVALQQRAWSDAMAQFRKIIDDRGQAPLSPLRASAFAGFARAATRSGDTAAARRAYQDLFSSLRETDASLPLVQQAAIEHRKLSPQ